eukprot:1998523-Pyramimonas_sp.AAC.1
MEGGVDEYEEGTGCHGSRASTARYPRASKEAAGTPAERGTSLADKLACLLKHLRRLRDNQTRRRQAMDAQNDDGRGEAW